MPLVNDLHNKAMRERHWNQIKTDSNKRFDESSEEFTLEIIIDLHFEENAGLINEISEAATKEFDIERVKLHFFLVLLIFSAYIYFNYANKSRV